MSVLIIIGCIILVIWILGIIVKGSGNKKESLLPSILAEKGMSADSEIFVDGLTKKHYVAIDKINKKVLCVVLANKGIKKEIMFDKFNATGNAILVDENDDFVKGIITDSESKRLIFIEMTLGFILSKEFEYGKIISVELLKNNAKIESVSNTSTIGRSIAGGLVAGSAGAIIGGSTAERTSIEACSSLSIKILLNDENEPSYVLDLYRGKPIKDIDVLPLGIMADKANNIISLIIRNNKNN